MLMVEDSKMVQQVLRHLASQYLHIPVDFAASLRDAAGLIKNNKYTIALVDLNLPDAPNGEVAKLTLKFGIPTVVLTGSIDEFKRQQMLEMGVVDYVLKENRDSYIYAVKQLALLLKNQGKKVLVADDSATSRTMMRQMLARLLYQVIEVEDGQQAYELLINDRDIKLLMTDYAMPVMDGFELAKKIRSKRGRDELAIIGISGSGSQSLSAKFIKHGANDFLTKPFLPEEFHCRVMQTMEQISLIETIKDAANRDYLTGLYNRRYFYSYAQQYLENNNQATCLALLDIDHFKQINDTYGHQAGDDVLVELSEHLQAYFSDMLMARVGGEEFALLMPNCAMEQAFEMLDNFRFKLSSTQIDAGEHLISVTVSIGVSEYLGDSLQDLINHADIALYDAKGGGRNQVCQYGSDAEE